VLQSKLEFSMKCFITPAVHACFGIGIVKAAPALCAVTVCVCVSGRPQALILNPLNTKRKLLYLKTQFVPPSKHFSSGL
jgi:hypothetical protein